jgi:hypothetical protein
MRELTVERGAGSFWLFFDYTEPAADFEPDQATFLTG